MKKTILLGLMLVLVTTIAQAAYLNESNPELLAYWNFDVADGASNSTVLDLHNASYANNTLIHYDSTIELGLYSESFTNYGGNYSSTPSTDLIRNDSVNWAISLWAKRNGSGTQYFIGESGQYRMGILTNEARFILFNSSGDTYSLDTTTNPILEDVWYFYTFVVNNTHFATYINGTYVTSMTYSGGLPANKNSFSLGRGYSTFTSQQWLGQVDEVAIWNKSLTSAEVLSLYQTYVPPPVVATTNANATEEIAELRPLLRNVIDWFSIFLILVIFGGIFLGLKAYQEGGMEFDFDNLSRSVIIILGAGIAIVIGILILSAFIS